MMVRAMVAPLCRGVAPATATINEGSGHCYKFWWMKVVCSQFGSFDTAYGLTTHFCVGQRKSVPVYESYPAFSIG
jgi:hypothetical protein